MSKPAKFFLGGFLCAILICATGIFLIVRPRVLEFEQVRHECLEEGSREKLGSMSNYLCDPEVLKKSKDLFGIYKKLVSADANVTSSVEMTLNISLFVLLVSILPWAWYFILQRIREIVKAVSGR